MPPQIPMRSPFPGGGMVPPPPPMQNQGIAAMRKQRLEEPWTYYDTRIYGAAAFPGDAAAQNFAQIVSPIPFFNQRTVNNGGYTLTNFSDTGKTDEDFLADIISIDVMCETDAPSVAGIATAPAFVETIVQFGVFELFFGTNVKLILPVVKCPSGGGIVQEVKIRNQAIAANADSGHANNGYQAATAKMYLAEQIFFPAGTAFTCRIEIPNDAANATGPLARVQALAPLTGNFNAGIRVNLEGTRGRRIAAGFPAGGR